MVNIVQNKSSVHYTNALKKNKIYLQILIQNPKQSLDSKTH